jgi:hypothetical protein
MTRLRLLIFGSSILMGLSLVLIFFGSHRDSEERVRASAPHEFKQETTEVSDSSAYAELRARVAELETAIERIKVPAERSTERVQEPAEKREHPRRRSAEEREEYRRTRNNELEESFAREAREEAWASRTETAIQGALFDDDALVSSQVRCESRSCRIEGEVRESRDLEEYKLMLGSRLAELGLLGSDFMVPEPGQRTRSFVVYARRPMPQ